jgi:hypothetical protein
MATVTRLKRWRRVSVARPMRPGSGTFARVMGSGTRAIVFVPAPLVVPGQSRLLRNAAQGQTVIVMAR